MYIRVCTCICSSIGPIHKNVSGKRFINYNRLIILPFILSISFCTSFGRIKFVSFQGSRISLKISAQNSMLRICETFSFIFCWRRVTVDFPNKMTDYIPMKKTFLYRKFGRLPRYLELILDVDRMNKFWPKLFWINENFDHVCR